MLRAEKRLFETHTTVKTGGCTFISISSAVFGGVLRAFSAIFSNSSHNLRQPTKARISFLPKRVPPSYVSAPARDKTISLIEYLMNVKHICVHLSNTHLLFIYYIPNDGISDTETSER